MKSLRKKFSSLIAPIVASAALSAGGIAHAENNTSPPPNTAPIVQKAEQDLIDFEQFRGKNFEERALIAEEIVQRYNLQHETEFSDIVEVIIHQAPTHPAQLDPKTKKLLGDKSYKAFDDVDAVNEALEIVRLGRLKKEIDTSLPCAQQLRSCGFDLLADVLENKANTDSLSDDKKAEIFEQKDIGKYFFELPALPQSLMEQEGGYVCPTVEGKTTINGHKMKDENLYIVNTAKKVQQKIQAGTTPQRPPKQSQYE